MTDTFIGAGGARHSVGQLTSPTQAKVAVGAASTAVLAEDKNRVYALFVNASASTIYLQVDGEDAAAATGIPLYANGGSYEMTLREGNVSTQAVNAISDGAGKDLFVVSETAAG